LLNGNLLKYRSGYEKKRPEFWAIVLDINDKRYYLRKGYWTVFMSDINFIHLFSNKERANTVKHHVDQLILGNSGYNILIDNDKNIVNITNPNSITIMEVFLSV
jgi:hypothetical protein